VGHLGAKSLRLARVISVIATASCGWCSTGLAKRTRAAEPAEEFPMWSAVLVASLLAQTPSLKIASPGLQAVNIKEDEINFYSDHLAQALTTKGVPVVTKSEITQLLGIERQKQLLGCSDDSCMSELANALGADGLVTGSIGKIGTQYQINVKVIRMRDAKAVAVFSAQTSSAEAILKELTRAAEEMFPDVLTGFGLKVEKQPFKVFPAVVPVAVGVLGLVGGAVCFSLAAEKTAQLRDPMSTLGPAAAVDARDFARTLQGAGVASLSVGGAALIGGVILGLVTNTRQSSITVAVVPTTTGMAAVGTFP
jgi:hypothetical protein